MAKIMTSSSRVGIGPSQRLRKLQSYYFNEMNIWDIGCDHGQLGLSFVNNPAVKTIQLVDPSIKVVETLKKTVADSYITMKDVFIHQKNGQEIKIVSKNNLIFMAGMGGKEIGEIITQLLPQLDSTSRMVISPHRKILELRSLLHDLPVSLLKESVLMEDKQFYQILYLKVGITENKVPLYGDEIWNDEIGELYRQHQINAFERHWDVASKAYVESMKQHKVLKLTPKKIL